MEARNITIVSTQNQNKVVVNTDATTLRELKIALNTVGVDYEGMTFYEGLSHTELLTDNAVLPHDVPYRGTTTNELVFMLTVPNKKIRSGITSDGSTRQALYDAIADLDLKQACIDTYGKNFTQCRNSELMSLIEQHQDEEETPVCEGNNLVAALQYLMEVLECGGCILRSDREAVEEILYGKKEAVAPYSDSEINKMFDFLNN